MMPQVSVVIDTYNYDQYIEQAVESVLAQDWPAERLEVLVIDDGSTDDTEQRIQKYGARIRYLRKSNGGQASSFNFGVRESRGEIVAFLDADDYWLPGKLRAVLQAFERNPEAGMVHHRLLELDTRTNSLRDGAFNGRSGDFSVSRKSILSFDPSPTSALAFRRAVLEKMLPIPESITIQADGYLQALAPFLAPIIAVDEPLAVYRVHDSNLFYLSAPESSKNRERFVRRAATLRAIVGGQIRWFQAHSYDLRRAPVRASIRRWTSVLESEEFAVAPPRRFRFFWHLARANANSFPVMTWRHRVVSCINTLGALFTGYRRHHLLDDWRIGIKQRIVRPFPNRNQHATRILPRI